MTKKDAIYNKISSIKNKKNHGAQASCLLELSLAGKMPALHEKL